MEEKREKDLKDLSQLIVSALTRDEGVMNALADLKKRKVIEPSTLLGLALKINDLLEISGAAVSEEDVRKIVNERAEQEEKPEPARRPLRQAVSFKQRTMIDGRELSREEILFEEWAIANFNERDWLKKSGLIW